ncbi:MLP-like protein 43 [Solanum tuberosum]|uniref:Major latex protein n=1 Tax=Solanum tuberosum TaxID=4113 RepID=M1B314_SOLTU|nr:PREDICTED: MLP-like protein 43 [Solanum tuberosum]
MGLEGKLISQIEMKCSGHLLHDHFKSNPHKTSVMSPDKITNFTIHEGQLGKTNSVVTWNYILEEKMITWTLAYEKLNENTPEPLDFMEFLIGLIKDVETHHVRK